MLFSSTLKDFKTCQVRARVTKLHMGEEVGVYNIIPKSVTYNLNSPLQMQTFFTPDEHSGDRSEQTDFGLVDDDLDDDGEGVR